MSELPKSFSHNFVWVASNHCEGKLDHKAIKSLTRIFYEFVDYFYTKSYDEGVLLDITKGLGKLANKAKDLTVNEVAGIHFE